METIAYNSGLLALTNGSVSFESDNVYAVLLGSGYTPNLAHDTYSDLTNEVTDEDYDPVPLTNKSVSLSDDTVVYDADDVSFGSEVSIAARYIVFVVGDHAEPSAGDALLWYADLGEVASVDAPFVVRTTNGLYEIAPVSD